MQKNEKHIKTKKNMLLSYIEAATSAKSEIEVVDVADYSIGGIRTTQ